MTAFRTATIRDGKPLRYAMQKYGHFREVQLEEQSEAPRLP